LAIGYVESREITQFAKLQKREKPDRGLPDPRKVLLLYIWRPRRVLVEHANQMRCPRRHSYLLCDEDVLGLDLTPIEIFVYIAILIHARAIQGNTSKQATRACIGVDL